RADWLANADRVSPRARVADGELGPGRRPAGPGVGDPERGGRGPGRDRLSLRAGCVLAVASRVRAQRLRRGPRRARVRGVGGTGVALAGTAARGAGVRVALGERLFPFG